MYMQNLYTDVHNSIIHNSQKCRQPKLLYPGDWINKVLYIHTMEYYLAIKRNEVLVHTISYMNLESIMLCEISQSQKTIYVPFI